MADWFAHRIQVLQPTDKTELIDRLNHFDITGIEEHDDGITVYYQQETLFTELKALCQILDITADHQINIQKDQNWNALWEKSYPAIHIDDYCLIHAYFHEVDASDFEHVIEITPQMSFGTGHHETTRLMIQAMRGLDFTNKRILDFGTGTGILAILSSKLGGREITAIENISVALDNARANAKINHSNNIHFILADTAFIPNQRFDIILVNIVRKVIVDNLHHLAAQLTNNGKLIISGFLINDVEMIRFEVQKHSLHFIAEFRENDWCALLFQNSISA